MIRTLRTVAIGAAAAALVVGMTASPAAAKTRTFTDKRTDAVAALDITKVKVKNKKHAVVVRMTVPDFDKSKLGSVMLSIRTKSKGRPTFMVTKARIEGAGWMPPMFLDPTSEDIIVACKGDRVTFGAKSVTVRVPQRCLGANRKAVRVQPVLMGRDPELEMLEELPEPGPDAPLDAYPTFSARMSPWVGYR
ncbi:hypothetical protein FE697_016600 [Mumia zhuanghuii]|uniref:Uncharacterized protein n=2 Tax=Mumia TaxID=1546255 RepID=A0ABW1QRW5_9ACTN|nr:MULTISPECIES: hypothetical protein [Mumia]KAA1420571.1 hypothetical protein FE697_016600 [Mumia zhuanghuii]